MNATAETLALIKKQVSDILPEAAVSLFGSRATDHANGESDWDILILTKHTPDKKTKRKIQSALFPLSLQLGSFINIIITSEKDWNTNPSYYVLQQSISAQSLIA